MIRDAIERAVERAGADAFEPHRETLGPDFVDRVVVPFAPVAAQAADFATTVAGMRAGLVEGNPFMRPLVKSLPVFALVKLGIGLGSAKAIHDLQEAGRPNAARVMSVVATLAGAGPAVNNYLLLRNRR